MLQVTKSAKRNFCPQSIVQLIIQKITMVNPINSQWLESKNKLKDLLSNLKCTICHEVLAEATVTNCGHSYCNLCIETWKKDQSKLLEYGQNKLVKCPNCNTEIKTLSTNHMLKNHIQEMCDILLSEQEKRVRQKTIQQNIDAQIERAAIARARAANALQSTHVQPVQLMHMQPVQLMRVHPMQLMHVQSMDV